MKTILSSRRHHYVARVSAFLIVVALIAAGIVACDGEEVGPLDHFKWYLADGEGSIDEDVYLKDQFCDVAATVGIVVGFGNPARKVHGAVTTPISNPDHHLTGYAIDYDEDPQKWLVEVKNQFGTQELTVSGPYGLAVPTQKEGHQSPVGLDHYMIYAVVDYDMAPSVAVSLKDQFDDEPQESTVYEPIYFANPVIKTHGLEVTEILNPEDHLVFYYIDADFDGEVDVVNQFGPQTLDIYPAFGFGGLAVPSEKIDWEKLEEELPEEPTTLVIGLARDLDGPLSIFECYGAGPVYRWFVDKVNANGGIYLSGYNATVQVELVVRDFDVMTWDLAAVTEALIDTDDVDFIWGGPGTDCIFTQAPVCNANGVLLITLEGGASSMIWDGDIDTWPYVWVSSSFANWYQIPVLYDMMVAEVGPDPKIYITYIGGAGATHGIEYREETVNEFGAGNVIDAGFHSYYLPSNPGEADAIITAASASYNSSPYDIFAAYTYPWNVAALTQACIDSEFNPPAILFGPGANYNDYPVYFGPYEEGIMSFIVANNSTSTAISDMYAELAAQVEADWDNFNLPCDQGPLATGWDRLDYWGQPCYVAALELWAAAVEDAGNLDSLDVRNSLASLNTTTVLGANTWYTVFGGGLGGGILAYETHPGEIGQWQSGVYEIVGGNSPTASFIYPMMSLWGWLP